MIENDLFQQLFDYKVQSARGLVSINEPETNATVRRLDIIGNGIEFHALPKVFCQHMASDKSSTSPCHRDADGIIIFENGTEKYVVVCELKSSSGQFSEAMKQVVSSYLGFCEAFSLIDGFDIGKFHVCFLITAGNDGKFLSWMDGISKKRRTQPLSFYETIVWNNSANKVCQGVFLSDPMRFNLPSSLNSSFISNPVTIAFRTASIDTGVVTIDVADLL